MAALRSRSSSRTRSRSRSGEGTRVARRVRFWAWILAILVLPATLAAWLITNTALSNVDAYGTVSVPGTKVLHFPAGNVEINFATNSAGGQGGSFFLPSMSLDVVSASGSGSQPTLKQASSSASAFGSQTRGVVFSMQVPRAGNYKVTATGDTSAYINPELLFGQGSPDGTIFELAGIILGSMVLIAIIAGRFVRPSDPPPTGVTALGPFRASTPFATSSSFNTTQAGGLPDSQSPAEFLTALSASLKTSGAAGQGAPAGAAGQGGPVGAASQGAPVRAAGQGAQLDELSKLADLHDRGVLTDAEFAAQKAKILDE
jgi:Short C-terminal domain